VPREAGEQAQPEQGERDDVRQDLVVEIDHGERDQPQVKRAPPPTASASRSARHRRERMAVTIPERIAREIFAWQRRTGRPAAGS